MTVKTDIAAEAAVLANFLDGIIHILVHSGHCIWHGDGSIRSAGCKPREIASARRSSQWHDKPNGLLCHFLQD